MMTKNAVWLEDRGVVRVSGEDAASFLQGVLTNDVEKLGPARRATPRCSRRRARSCSIFSSSALPADAGAAFALDCDAPAPPISPSGFRLLQAAREGRDRRRKRRPWRPRLLGRRAGERAGRHRLRRSARRRRWAIAKFCRAPRRSRSARPSVGDYEALRISLGVPKGGVDFAYGDAFPHDANMDLLHGVDFEKGCYVGQEVVSRMKHRGGVRKRDRARALSTAPAPAPGAAVMDGDLPVGTLGVVGGRDALALLRLDRVEEAKAAGRRLSAAGVGLAVTGKADRRRNRAAMDSAMARKLS